MAKYYCYLNADETGKKSQWTKEIMEGVMNKFKHDTEFVTYNDGHIKEGTLIIRSRSPEANNIIMECWRTGQQFVYIDSGYFKIMGLKKFHRFTLNHFQKNTITDRPDDRWKMFQLKGVTDYPWREGGNKIIICPPTEKSLATYNFSSEEWVEKSLTTLKKTHPDKEFIIRTKPNIKVRVAGNSLQDAMRDKDVYAVVCCGGGVGVDAALFGVPSYVHEHNAAAPIAQTNFTKDVIRPDKQAWLNSISYDQYNMAEMTTGEALTSVYI